LCLVKITRVYLRLRPSDLLHSPRLEGFHQFAGGTIFEFPQCRYDTARPRLDKSHKRWSTPTRLAIQAQRKAGPMASDGISARAQGTAARSKRRKRHAAGGVGGMRTANAGQLPLEYG